MKKTECVKAAETADRMASEAKNRFELYLSVFGGKNNLTESACTEMKDAIAASSFWRRITEWSYAARCAALRNNEIPSKMFIYSALSR